MFSPQCSYCYLKSSFWYLPDQQAFDNIDSMLRQVCHWIAQDNLESYVLNSGNLSDSLCFESVRPVIGKLVEVFREEAERKNRPHSLLLVTKGGREHCQVLLDSQPCANVIVSFSVNSRQAAKRHETGAASVEDRIETAGRLMQQGWRVRMRIDPMIAGYEYTWVIEQVRRLQPERLTLGTLRAESNLNRFVPDNLFDHLEQPAEGGLARYPRRQRLEMYKPAIQALRNICPIGLCEETPDVWEALGLNTEEKSCNCGN
jgi:DNA repair photolyase